MTEDFEEIENEGAENREAPIIEALLTQWFQNHCPHHRPELDKQFISILEVMSYLNSSAGRIDPETFFDSEYVLKSLHKMGYQSTTMGGTVHFIYYQ